MKASVVELRTKMKDIAKALSRNEPVTILSHGVPFGELIPFKKLQPDLDLAKHPFVGMFKQDSDSVEAHMEKLRGPRYPC